MGLQFIPPSLEPEASGAGSCDERQAGRAPQEAEATAPRDSTGRRRLNWVLSEHILGYFAAAAGLLAEAGPLYGP